MLSRNRELRRALTGALAIVAASAIVAVLVMRSVAWADDASLNVAAALIVVLASDLALLALFLVVTRRRYEALARMAERVDDALHDDRSVSLADMSEGELAILASEVDKALTRLTLSAEELDAERRSLADSLADISHQLRTPLTSLGLTLALVRKEALEADASRREEALETDASRRETSAGADPATHKTRDCPVAHAGALHSGPSSQGPDTAGADLLAHVRMSERLVSQLQWLVEALLKLARIDAGAVRLRRDEVDVAALVEEATSPLAISYELANVSLERSIQAGASFTGDAAWTREALENVFKNCLEHTPAGGTVRVEATQDVVACRIRVTDTGTGIAEEDLPHVFERFYRGKRAGASRARETGVSAGPETGAAGVTASSAGGLAGTQATNPSGVGIGLSLAQALVTAQDGRITARNARDAKGDVTGAQFDITFFRAVV